MKISFSKKNFRDVSLFKYLEFKIIGYMKVRVIKSIECEYN